MQKLIIQHSNRLLLSSAVLAERNNINVIPFPSKHFKNNKDLENYLTTLTNFIKHPELFYLQKNKVNTIDIKDLNSIPNKYFKFIN